MHRVAMFKGPVITLSGFRNIFLVLALSPLQSSLTASWAPLKLPARFACLHGQPNQKNQNLS